MAENEGQHKLIDQEMRRYREDFDRLNLVIRETVQELKAGAEAMRQTQQTIKEQNTRLAEGQSMFGSIKKHLGKLYLIAAAIVLTIAVSHGETLVKFGKWIL